ncbi:YpmS family protein [Lentilactobacillus sp. Marseille-Q4993]|uniref:YpmS family protein n=1 Tax=Lentilactobacillus sp. Marseille-Q4993 TaxID=3039492 RepID=UPI0024BC9968|nr:YpmS family protein [Lentilactobacillus sp. Marseille-Q4993]
MHSKSKNPYKIAFWSLIAVILLGIVFVFGYVLTAGGGSIKESAVPTTKKLATVSMKKEQINSLSSFYLKKFQSKNGKVQYRFVVKDQGIVYGTFDVLGSKVDYGLSFKPTVMKDGNVKLKATTLSIANFKVPASVVLSFVKHNYNLPKWVSLDPLKKNVYLDIRNINGKNGVNFKADKISLKGDGAFKFDVLLPSSK